jgi:hypothetical protein
MYIFTCICLYVYAYLIIQNFYFFNFCFLNFDGCIHHLLGPWTLPV